LIGEIQAGLEGSSKNKQWGSVKTWSSLLDGPPLFDPTDMKAKQVGEVAPITVNRFRRVLRRITQTRQSGIFVDQLSRNHCELTKKIQEIKGGHSYVVDIYNLKDEEKPSSLVTSCGRFTSSMRKATSKTKTCRRRSSSSLTS